MTYLYSVLAQVGDKKAFSEASQTWVGGNLEKLGVRSYSATEIVMGGEMAGMVVIGFEYDSVDAAMAGQAGFYHDDQLVGMMQDTQVQINRRILFRVQSERGERRGQKLDVNTVQVSSAAAATTSIIIITKRGQATLSPGVSSAMDDEFGSDIVTGTGGRVSRGDELTVSAMSAR